MVSSICALNLLDARLDLLLFALALDDGRLVLVGGDAARLAEVLERACFEVAAGLFADDLAAGQDGDVVQHRLAAIAEARRLDREHVEHAAQLVDDQRRQRFAVDVLGDDHDVALADLDQLLQHRHDVRDGADLLVGDQDVGSSITASMRSGW